MFSEKEIELQNGEKITLKEEEVNYMAGELIEFLPEYILRRWLKQTSWIEEEFKPILLKLKKKELKEKLGFMFAFFVAHRRYKLEKQQEQK
jgi:hypothetical protein